MADKETLRKVPNDSPDRCQSTNFKQGQCQFAKVPGSDYCRMHGGNNQAVYNSQASLRLYNLSLVQDRLNRQADHPRLKSLNEEIGLIRILIETKINSCQNDSHLMIQSQSISDLILKLNNLIANASKLDLQLKETITRTQLDNYVNLVLAVLSKHCEPDLLERVAEELATIEV